MPRDAYSDRARLALFVTEAGWRTVRTHAMAQPARPWRMATIPVPGRLVLAPQDLRTGDATRAGDIYSGRFAFAGKVVNTGGLSPFEVEPPSREWAEELMGFGWLRHLRAAETAIARANARALVSDWMTLRAHRQPGARTPEVCARRIISWLSQAQLILQEADQAFFRRVVQSLTAQVRHLRSLEFSIRDGYPRLLAAMALCFAGLCMADQSRLLRIAQRRVVEELERQILPDGGHVSRNPGLLVEILLDLLPLRQAFHARNLPPPAPLMNAIDRMMPMLRFFRHGDGAFALFNGMGPTPGDSLATVLAYDDARGVPVANAPHSGYQRIEAGGTVVIADTGTPPPMAMSHEAHAGCLSFELSSGRSRIVLNCGVPAVSRDAWRPMARRTAAHSTVTVEEVSSCRFIADGMMMRLCGTPVVEGPGEVKVERFEHDGAHIVRASHDGYVRRFGILHQRSWRLSRDGRRLDGEDVLRPVGGATFEGDQPDRFAVRFHLHHAVAPSRLADGHTVLLAMPGGENWIFAAPNLRIDIEESLMLAASGGARRCDQLVISGRVRHLPRLVWTFMRADGGGMPREKR